MTNDWFGRETELRLDDRPRGSLESCRSAVNSDLSNLSSQASHTVWGANAATNAKNPGPKVHLLKLYAAVVMSFLLPSCTSNSTYMGIPLSTGQADIELQQLATRARAGDKQAQLNLGVRFEEGRGVTQDLGRAIRLYHMAASDSGGTLWIYSPPVGNGTKGRVIAVDHGIPRAGLEEAKNRLEALGE